MNHDLSDDLRPLRMGNCLLSPQNHGHTFWKSNLSTGFCRISALILYAFSIMNAEMMFTSPSGHVLVHFNLLNSLKTRVEISRWSVFKRYDHRSTFGSCFFECSLNERDLQPEALTSTPPEINRTESLRIVHHYNALEAQSCCENTLIGCSHFLPRWFLWRCAMSVVYFTVYLLF